MGEEVLIFVWFFLTSLAISILSFPYIFSFLQVSGAVKKNFRGKVLPISGGILIILIMFAVLAITSLFFLRVLDNLKNLLPSVVILVVGVGFLGFTDDLLGTRKTTGFRGHFGYLAKGRLTSGSIKALGIGALSLYIASLFSQNFFLLLTNALLLAFFVNTFNLLDLRPGRCVKLFLISALLMFLFSYKSQVWLLAGIFLGPILTLFYADLKEQLILGDVGSNILGAILGFNFMVNFNWIPKIVVLVFLLIIQIYAERYSLTELIKRVSFLRWFDELGRAPD